LRLQSEQPQDLTWGMEASGVGTWTEEYIAPERLPTCR
jgi:hypothetical protein